MKIKLPPKVKYIIDTIYENNYEAYIVTKVKLEDKQYIKEGTNYTIRLVEDNGYTLKGYLKKVNETEDGIELFFLITNGVEELADLRDVEIWCQMCWYMDSIL